MPGIPAVPAPARDEAPVDGRVFLVRHGRTVLNDQGRLRGRLDPPLSDVGRAEVFETATLLAPEHPTRVVCSPLSRARETARAIAVRVGLTPIDDERLSDRDYGDWAGHEPPEVLGRYGSYDATPGVERSESLTARALAALNDQLRYLGDGPVVMVAHDAVNSYLLHALEPSLGDPEAIVQRTACWNLITRRNDKWHVERVDQR